MIHLPTEPKQRTTKAIADFERDGELSIFEPCNCGNQIRHNNGGNYHQEIYLKRDGKQVFVKYDDTCELTAPAEWEACDDWQKVITDNADWL